MPAATQFTLAGRFADPTVESAYQTAETSRKRALGRLLMLGILSMDAVFAPIDLFNYGLNAHGGTAAMILLVSVVWSLACWWWMGKAVSARAVEQILLVWVPLVVFLNILTLTILPGNHIGAAAAYTVAVVLSYLLPFGLGWCAATGVSVTVLYLGLLVWFARPESGGHLFTDTLVGLVLANVLGAIVGRQLQIDRRRQYAAGVQLTEAMAEVNSLRGLLPICACCKRIRDDVGGWQRVEQYIQARTDARFTHGVCPACMESEYGITVTDDDHPTITPP